MMPHPGALRRRAAAILAGMIACGAGCRDPWGAPPEAVGPPSPACALAGLDAAAIPFVLETSEGTVRCSLDGARAPRAVSMVVGLATGRAPFRERGSGAVVRRPYFDEIPFFRAIAGSLVQTGCRVGDGSGHPGYRIPVESAPEDEARLARPGALFLARYTPPPNRDDPAPPPPGDVIGTQLVVGLNDLHHLAGKVTILGTCGDLDVVRRIAGLVSSKERRVDLLHAGVSVGPGGAALPDGPCPAEAAR